MIKLISNMFSPKNYPAKLDYEIQSELIISKNELLLDRIIISISISISRLIIFMDEDNQYWLIEPTSADKSMYLIGYKLIRIDRSSMKLVDEFKLTKNVSTPYAFNELFLSTRDFVITYLPLKPEIEKYVKQIVVNSETILYFKDFKKEYYRKKKLDKIYVSIFIVLVLFLIFMLFLSLMTN